MSSATIENPEINTTSSNEPADDYRALHSGAVVGPVAAVVSLFFPFMVASSANFIAVFPLVGLPIVALGLSLWALSSIRGAQQYYTGLKLAAFAALVSAISLFGGLGYGGYVYATEVPDGYARTSFLELKPSDEDVQKGIPIPPVIQELGGKKVFIKGYMRPDSTKSRVNNREFLLVRDANQCCFGDLSQVAFFDQVQVNLKAGKTADLRPWVFRVGGTLKWRPGRQHAGEPLVVYSIEADYIK